MAFLATILLLGAFGAWLFESIEVWIAILVYVVFLLPVIARQQRALEVMVHEGSHYNWLRRNRRWNDLVTNWLAARPVFSAVASFRQSHFVHHQQFGSDRDPCLQRYEQMRLEALDRSSSWSLIRGIAARLPGYIAGYYRAVGSSTSVLVLSLAWHAAFVVLPLTLAVGIGQALTWWALFWGIPMLVSLPVLRFIAEAEEHDYDRGVTEFEATISSLGWIHHWLIHPFGDGYHVIHHMLPFAPGTRLKELHALLMAECSVYREVGLKRTDILATPASQ